MRFFYESIDIALRVADEPPQNVYARRLSRISNDLAQKRLIKVLPECEAHLQKWLYGIDLPNRYLSSKVRLFLDAVENGLTA